MGIQPTSGQLCLLGLMQEKLVGLLKQYSHLRVAEKEATPGSLEQRTIAAELRRLRDRIKRMSARQKRFTTAIIHKNSIHTIPKESYLRALGLVTKETLSQLNCKRNERRRRTTANPRFSHEAIQAKRALQKPRNIEPMASREKRIESARSSSASNKAASAASNNRQRQVLYDKFKSVQQELQTKVTNVKDKMHTIITERLRTKLDEDPANQGEALLSYFKCDESLDEVDMNDN